MSVLVVNDYIVLTWTVDMHLSLSAAMLPRLNLDSWRNIEGADNIVHVAFDQVVFSPADLFVVGEALFRSLLGVIIVGAGNLILIVDSD